MPEVPRLTRALRAFTHLGRTKEESEAYISDLTNKRLERAVQRTRELSWKKFCTNLPKTTGPLLAQIRNAAAKFCGKIFCPTDIELKLISSVFFSNENHTLNFYSKSPLSLGMPLRPFMISFLLFLCQTRRYTFFHFIRDSLEQRFSNFFWRRNPFETLNILQRPKISKTWFYVYFLMKTVRK